MSYIYNDSILTIQSTYKVQDILRGTEDTRRYKGHTALLTRFIQTQANVRILNQMRTVPIRSLINVKGYEARPVHASNADGFAVTMLNDLKLPVGQAYLNPERVTDTHAVFDIEGKEVKLPLNILCSLVKIKEKVTKESKVVAKEEGVNVSLIKALDNPVLRENTIDPLPTFVHKLFPKLVLEEVREEIKKMDLILSDMDGNLHSTIAEVDKANTIIRDRILAAHVKIMVTMEYDRQVAEKSNSK